MTIDDFFRLHGFYLSDKGRECFRLAIKEHYPFIKEDRIVNKFIWAYDLNDEDVARLVILANKYAKLWAFS